MSVLPHIKIQQMNELAWNKSGEKINIYGALMGLKTAERASGMVNECPEPALPPNVGL